jgi:hypothetical protein
MIINPEIKAPAKSNVDIFTQQDRFLKIRVIKPNQNASHPLP